MARAWNGLQGLRVAWQEAVWCCSAPDTLEANISVSDVWDHSAKTGRRLLALGVSVFCFDKVLRRRHRGSVTQRSHQYLCVYDYEGRLKQFNNTFHTRARVISTH